MLAAVSPWLAFFPERLPDEKTDAVRIAMERENEQEPQTAKEWLEELVRILLNKQWANIPDLFFVYFCLFEQKIPFLQQIYVKKCPSRIQCCDSNPRPLEHEYPPITTRPGQGSRPRTGENKSPDFFGHRRWRAQAIPLLGDLRQCQVRKIA